MKRKKFSEAHSSHPVMIFPDDYEVFDFSKGYDPKQVQQFIENGKRAVGGYLERRRNMYLAPQYQNKRNIHMGIDFWAPAGEAVYAAFPGEVVYVRNNAETGNYGPTVVLKQAAGENELFALYGHLSVKSLEYSKPGKIVEPGDIVGWLGTYKENGEWPPHLHYQLSINDPEEADMPGVVSPEEAEKASSIYPDPRNFIGPIY
ncbi:MAG: peptidoglycan DD-metalloendopeptidase family protein [Balneolaceae bacterium]|nr:peptidoglycan DD-metalloendopeptidase family protein [Balneolaceae bacterium]